MMTLSPKNLTNSTENNKLKLNQTEVKTTKAILWFNIFNVGTIVVHDSEREHIKNAGFERSVSEHTYEHRLKEVIEFIQERIWKILF